MLFFGLFEWLPEGPLCKDLVGHCTSGHPLNQPLRKVVRVAWFTPVSSQAETKMSVAYICNSVCRRAASGSSYSNSYYAYFHHGTGGLVRAGIPSDNNTNNNKYKSWVFSMRRSSSSSSSSVDGSMQSKVKAA